jgi:hypothetical protein
MLYFAPNNYRETTESNHFHAPLYVSLAVIRIKQTGGCENEREMLLHPPNAPQVQRADLFVPLPPAGLARPPPRGLDREYVTL